MLGAREDQERAGLAVEDILQQVELAILLHFVDVQFDVLGGLGGGSGFDAHGVANVGFDQVLDRGFDGGGEQQRLPRGGHGVHDALDGGEEAHVEHAVGFIEHQHADAR